MSTQRMALSLLDAVSGRVDQLEDDWHDNPTHDDPSTDHKKEPLSWT